MAKVIPDLEVIERVLENPTWAATRIQELEQLVRELREAGCRWQDGCTIEDSEEAGLAIVEAEMLIENAISRADRLVPRKEA